MYIQFWFQNTGMRLLNDRFLLEIDFLKLLSECWLSSLIRANSQRHLLRSENLLLLVWPRRARQWSLLRNETWQVLVAGYNHGLFCRCECIWTSCLAWYGRCFFKSTVSTLVAIVGLHGVKLFFLRPCTIFFGQNLGRRFLERLVLLTEFSVSLVH